MGLVRYTFEVTIGIAVCGVVGLVGDILVAITRCLSWVRLGKLSDEVSSSKSHLYLVTTSRRGMLHLK